MFRVKIRMNHLFHTGDRVETAIERIAFGGEGVGRIEDLVIFVPYTAEGDFVRARITSVKKNYLKGKIDEILSPSPFRVAPRCGYYPQCGGCNYQHISYERQLQIKRTQVSDAFERIGRMRGAPVSEVLASESPYGYRGKAEFHADCGTSGGLQIGFMNPGGNRPIDIERCEIVDESINRSYARIRRDLVAEWTRNGRRRFEKRDLTVWSDAEDLPDPEKGATAPGFISRRVRGRLLDIPRNGFFQANGTLIDRLVDAVIAGGEPRESDTVLDAYCGSGLFSLFIAGRCRSVLGIEIDPDAVGCACRNTNRFGIVNAGFREGRTEEMIIKLKNECFRPDLVILDPPRTGCEQGVMEGISALNPERIVYVSCDPATLARDIAVLVRKGFHLERVQPIDMFPQTKHIEIVAALRKV